MGMRTYRDAIAECFSDSAALLRGCEWARRSKREGVPEEWPGMWDQIDASFYGAYLAGWHWEGKIGRRGVP